MAKLTTVKTTTAKTAKWLTIGLTTTLLALTACSTPEASSPQADQAAQPPAAEPDADAKPTDTKEAFRPVTNVTLAPGADPMALVFATRQSSAEPTGSEQIRVSYPAPDKALVTVTKTGLADDSVAAIRTRYEFTPVTDAAEGAKQWQLTQVGEQNKCQRDRGPQDWSAELCN